MAVRLTVVELKPAPFVSLLHDYFHPLTVLKAFRRRCYLCVMRKWLQQTKPQLFSLSLSLARSLSHLSFSVFSFLLKEEVRASDCYLTVSGIRCSIHSAQQQTDRLSEST